MDLTTTAYGTWSGGRFMHYGETLPEERYLECIRTAYDAGIRTFVTADVYGNGKADELLGVALEGVDRDSYCLVGMIGHDFYVGQRQGNKGYPRFTDPELRGPGEYKDYMRMACSKSLERCRTDRFDLLMLHNPDDIGYTSEAVWDGMLALKEEGLTDRLGIAPGPANGFTLDIIQCFERFGRHIDWAMLILNPLEPWPTGLVLPACEKFGVKVLTRVVDYGGVFHGELKPGHAFKPGDHRAYRPQGWVEHGLEKAERMLPLADKYKLTPIQFASIWNLSQPMVESAVPTFFQEATEDARSIDEQIREFAALPDVRFTPEESEQIRAIGDNTGCMTLKGASKRHQTSERADEWPMRPELLELAGRYDLGVEW
ncbi:aldo/keto reductase [Luteolibacter sp. LG18]|uniref:aldo/keto reductase n=1 Tax=Luteolibacter sp. LG18 TaxID=2819286 RepID=UPI002B2CD52E|nr:general stress protein [Luteolibacter sp. LG18]